MKIGVSSSGDNLEALVNPRFGRCPYFLIVNPNDLSLDVWSNPEASAMGGAGVQATQFIANKGVNILITGNIGPKAFNAINAAGIKVYTHVFGTVKEVVELFNRGKLNEISHPNVRSHQGRIGFGGRGYGRRW